MIGDQRIWFTDLSWCHDPAPRGYEFELMPPTPARDIWVRDYGFGTSLRDSQDEILNADK